MALNLNKNLKLYYSIKEVAEMLTCLRVRSGTGNRSSPF